MSIAPRTEAPCLMSVSSLVFLAIFTAMAMMSSFLHPVSFLTIFCSSISDWYSRRIHTKRSSRASLSRLVPTNSSGFWVAIMRNPGLALIVPILGMSICLSSMAGSSTFWVPSGIRFNSLMKRKEPALIAWVRGPGMNVSLE